ncbi:MAG: polysaccharide deacetylase family protein [Candidatus Cloacimonetes bacterium]|nr:polysaccharide deacetylase family protein [Candidatus Cloacimonadota bacterium]MCF7813294.1 polysaccharide deacetylase family protein [Candidatus Cloacimonadota bacterium]MCF7867369.1 polysaccharide deacetylase family protein [Candidatus Cloacimonadota bacterium]MCF7882803.1 polysaccharide deacetylase family protein [Candidatus Cloacimonadota bacterium]
MFGCKNVHFSFSGQNKNIALTFDDGPHPVHTQKILEIIKQHQVKATFFVSGCKIEKYKKIIKNILENGHQVANHSMDHRNFIFRSQRSMREDIKKTEKLLRKCGVEGDIPFRPPYGRFDLNTFRVMKTLNKQMIIWNASTKDFKATSKQQILKRLYRKVKPGCIIVMHDAGKFIDSTVDRNFTIEALKEALPNLKNEGYNFLTINEMLIEN